tara:strand:+ start:300 stop:1676 length:1377 start_codon:yes stop_codon:yes gene_type:complete
MFSSKIKNIHFIGIGGIGMSGMAELLTHAGYSISGSDLTENDRTRFLRSLGLRVDIGHNKDNIKDSNLVVFSSAVKKDNIEIKAAKDLGIPIIKRAEMLAELVRVKPMSIGVSGTHGKTTTCSLIGSILHSANLDPTMAVGGIVESFGTNAVSGKGDIIVVEADEYDKTFLSLNPVIAIINNIEEEHLDCYKDFQDLIDAFEKFVNNIPFYGFVLLNGDDNNISKIIKKIKRPIITYGLNEKYDYSAKNIFFDLNKSTFDLYHKNSKVDTVHLSIPGYHNIYNALCSIALSMEMGISIEVIKKSLSEFKGVRRRFDIKYNSEGNLYIDDYAHHPTEVRATIDAVKKGWPNKQITSIFQPHLYSRTKHFYKDFASSLSGSDKVILLDIYGSRESKIDNVTSELILSEINKIGDTDCSIANKDNLIEKLKQVHCKGDAVITMGAGDLWMKGDEIIGYLKK